MSVTTTTVATAHATPVTAVATPVTAVATTDTAVATPLWRTGARAGIFAALATTVIAAVALGVDVPLEIEGEQIPLAGFAQMTLLGTAIGVVLAKALVRWTAKPQRTFIATTFALTALSVVPDLAAAASAASKAVLITTHLVAAAIVIPAVANRLPAARTR
jgi:hypothetical protein